MLSTDIDEAVHFKPQIAETNGRVRLLLIQIVY